MAYKVLIVDDSKLARMAVNKLLNALRSDWPRVEAAAADEAVKAVVDAAPDLALIDFNMPGRSGLELAAELRQARPGMPVAVISANQQQEVLNRAAAVGAAFLPKPLTEQALAEFLNIAEKALQKAHP
jgi:CheY-like chemotaxis protein